jgi:hypothetical protein
MTSDVQLPDASIAYPTNRVVGTVGDLKRAQAAIEALLRAGFAERDIDVLHGEKDLHRTDPAGVEHSFLAQFQGTLIRALSDEYAHLRHYVEDVRAGRCVIMVLAKKRDRREAAADILGTHGAESIEFFGRWSWKSMEPHAAAPADDSLPDPMPGRTYEIDLGGPATRVRFDSESRVTIFRGSAGVPDLSRLPVTHLKPHLLMVTWQEADRTTNVHVYDFESGEAHAVVNHFNRSVHRARGTVRRAD